MSTEGVVSWPGGVFAVMDADRRALEGYLATLKWDHRQKWAAHPARHDEARAAVAALMEAAEAAEAFISIAVPSLAVHRNQAVDELLPKLRTALACVGGAK